MRIGTVYPDSVAYREPYIQPFFFFCPGRRISIRHRCKYDFVIISFWGKEIIIPRVLNTIGEL